jgi:hypothetical protein
MRRLFASAFQPGGIFLTGPRYDVRLITDDVGRGKLGAL